MFDIVNRTVPDLWKVCDGKDNTPDLIDMFIRKSVPESPPLTVADPPADSTTPTTPTDSIDLSEYLIIYIIKVKNLSN